MIALTATCAVATRELLPDDTLRKSWVASWRGSPSWPVRLPRSPGWVVSPSGSCRLQRI